jgi:enamine deaminase RidA (YjgF/YER057c/UK114 family)
VTIQRWSGTAAGRSRSAAFRGTVWTVSNATLLSAGIDAQIDETLDLLEQHLREAGSDKALLLSVQILLTDISCRDTFERKWCAWIGTDPSAWPQRAVFQVALAPGLLVEIIAVAAQQSVV